MSAAEDIRDFLCEIDGSISQVVSGHISIPTWSSKGENITEADKHHIKNLAIPTLREKAKKPSLLLHNLGHFSSDPNLKERIENIFMPDHHTFFFDTPGSGKTRLVLEGLCQNWGFYFTSSADSSRLGSTDIQQVIQAQSTGSSRFHSHIPPTGPSNYIKSLCHDRAIVSGDLRRVFLARLIILTLFAEKMYLDLGRDPHTSLNEYRKRWLLLQAFPQLGHPKGRDIFVKLAARLSMASDNWVTLRSETYLERLRDLIAPGKQGTQEKTPLFCVIDEVQFATTTLTRRTGSLSSNQEDDDGNIVGEFMRVLEEEAYGKFVHVFMVVTGTGIWGERVESAMTSAIKEESMHRKHTDTGAFNTAEAQRQYLTEYLPKSLIESGSGKRLLNRLWYWLHGRYGFTAGYVEELIRNGFRQPHRLLNNYVHHLTNFWISDAAEYLENEEQKLESPILSLPLDFNGFTKMLNSIYDVARNCLMGSGTRGIPDNAVDFIQYALARCVRSGTQRVSIDEPLVLLAVIHWMNSPGRQPVYEALARDLRTHSADKINGFEKYISHSLSLIFSKERPLNDVFTFHGIVPAWAGMNAELVSVFYDGAGNLDTGKTSLLELITPSATLGVDAKQADETLSWLQHRDRATFCFPHESMRPDILFVLRLPGDGSYIWVAIQAKWCESLGRIPRELVLDAMQSVTPSRFFLTKDGRSLSAYSDLREQVLESLRALPNKKAEAGPYSLLRVIASFPAPAMVDSCISEDPDDDGHPIATLNMDLVKEVTRELSPARKLEGIENDWRNSRSSRRTANTNKPKRKSGQEKPGRRPLKKIKI